MKFKVGDIVRFVGKYSDHVNYIEKDIPLKDLVNQYGNKLTISAIRKNYDEIHIKEDNFWCFKEEELEFINAKPTKQELLDMPVGTKIYTDAEDEEYQVWVKGIDGDFYNKDNDNLDENDINDDLTLYIYGTDYGTKIIKIEVPTYEIVYDYSTEVQEMTVAEIEKALGHTVKIIKEDK